MGCFTAGLYMQVGVDDSIRIPRMAQAGLGAGLPTYQVSVEPHKK